jgi:hypothetical protein
VVLSAPAYRQAGLRHRGIFISHQVAKFHKEIIIVLFIKPLILLQTISSAGLILLK